MFRKIRRDIRKIRDALKSKHIKRSEALMSAIKYYRNHYDLEMVKVLMQINDCRHPLSFPQRKVQIEFSDDRNRYHVNLVAGVVFKMMHKNHQWVKLQTKE